MKDKPFKLIREPAPKSYKTLTAALGLPTIWFILHNIACPVVSTGPVPPQRYFWHVVLLGVGAVLWLWAAYLLRQGWGERYGRIYRIPAVMLLFLFAVMICASFVLRLGE